MSDSPTVQRAKRQRIDKAGRFAALERLKNLKGTKNKYEVGEIDNVYDEVTEQEYANRVLSRADDDWIEEDGSGYVEDGREIFDEIDEFEETDERSSKKRKGEKSKPQENKKRLRDINKPTEGKGSIRSLFGNASSKKKEPQVKLGEDDILAGILGEIGPEASSSSGTKVEAGPSEVKKGTSASRAKLDAKTEVLMMKQYMANLTKTVPKNQTAVKNEATSDDDEMLERIMKPVAQIQPKTVEESDGKRKYEPEVSTEADEHVLMNDEENASFSAAPPSPPPTAVSVDHDIDMDGIQFDDFDFNVDEFKKEIVAKEKQNYENILSNWESIGNKVGDLDEEDALLGSIDTDAIPTIDDKGSNANTLKFWFWDAWEDPIKLPGKVYLFGRTPVANNPKEYRSICIAVEGIERNLYVLPRQFMLDDQTKQPTNKTVTFTDVYQEVNANIPHTFRSKKMTKHFAFAVPDVDVPPTSEYLNVRFDAKFPAMNTRKCYNSIAHIFGTNTNALETFLLECKIKGPCWLNVSNFSPMRAQSTWCSQAITCTGTASVSIAHELKNLPPPPLAVMTLYVRTALNTKTQTNEICMISALVNPKFSIDKRPPTPPFTKHFCAFARLSSQNWPVDIGEKLEKYKGTKANKCETERMLLSWFLSTYKAIDPDLIVTHDMGDCQLDIICDRLFALKLPMWSRIGRLNLSAMPKKFKDYFVGRMICDVKSSAEELIRSRSYDLDTLCQTVLKTREEERFDVSNDELHEMYESGDGILKLITLTMQDCHFVMRLMCELNVLPLALQITNICGNLMGRTLQGGRSERNEYLLLHAFDEKDYIAPDKKVRESNWSGANESNAVDQWGNFTQTQTQTQAQPQTQMQTQTQTQTGRKKPAYSGGLVLDPIKGFYEKFILLMDFNSLYPSIIQEYNICFTTIDWPAHDDDVVDVGKANEESGVLPRQLRNLVERRREVKKLMATVTDVDLRNQYDIRQMALKLTANSMYGCLGFTQSRFYAKHLAALVTQKGRDILMSTKEIVTKLNYEVIYGDTDSIMINTHSVDYDEVFKIGHNIKQSVNKIYRQVELDIDGVYKYMLLLNKKKYAAVKLSKSKTNEMTTSQELKGLDIVRRDWSQISVTAGKMVLEQLLSDLPLDERIDNIHVYLAKIRDQINDNKVPAAMMTITRQLTKAPREYLRITSLPHVQVALRMNSTKNKRFKKGDMINFVICIDGTDAAATQRAYHLDELKSNESLQIDKEYYLANQIYPVVSRLLKPIEATNSARIAECLGLDPTKYKEAGPRTSTEHAANIGESIIQSNAERFRACKKFVFKCIGCNTDNVIVKPFFKVDGQLKTVLEICSNKDCLLPPYKQLSNIRNHLTVFIRQAIRDYYNNWMYCDEPSCNQSTRTSAHVTDITNRSICVTCKQGHMLNSYTEGDLFKQLRYLQFMFQLPRLEPTQLRVDDEVAEAFKSLVEYVETTLKHSAYQTIDMSELFKQLHPDILINHYPSDLSTPEVPENPY